MKLLIASDIHGSAPAANIIMQRIHEFQPDRIALLGDLLYHGPRNDLPEGYAPKQVIPLLNDLKDRVVAVRGNCEAEVDQMVLDFPCMEDFASFEADGMMFAASHGHIYDPDKLPPLPHLDVFMSGHTHVKMLEKREGTIILNPGSTTIPKDGCASYATYEDGVFALRDMSGIVLKKLSVRS